MKTRTKVIIIEFIACFIEGVSLIGYLFDIPFLPLKALLVINFIVTVFMAVAWLKFVDGAYEK